METILESIYRAGLKFLTPLNLAATYAVITEEAVKLVKASYGSIFLGQAEVLQWVYSTLPFPDPLRVKKKGYLNESYKTCTPLIIDTEEVLENYPKLKSVGVKSMIFIPLSYRNKSIGVLVVHSKRYKHFTSEQRHILKLFASMASLAIEKMQIYNEAKKALELRDLFISMAAHELRTPITTVSGYAQLLHSKLSGADTPESRWVEELLLESTRLTQLVSELLVVNRIKSGELQYVLRECSLKEVVQRAISDFRFTQPDRKVVFHDHLSGDRDMVVADFDKILQVIINLLDNAAKFSSVETDISMELKLRSKYLVLQVKDEGQGIDKKDVPKIFEGFYKGRDPSKEGMGLGLFLAKNIIEEHHGSISVRSKINRGTTVEVLLPRVKISSKIAAA